MMLHMQIFENCILLHIVGGKERYYSRLLMVGEMQVTLCEWLVDKSYLKA
ncbi:hypothetical protein VCRA2120O332_60147 [Vibrio crassostreae]|nr:hypothetical protein VCRA2114E327_20144 [Vibrio crassostreae]CAK3675454.1 hypothetical protein VCRA2120O332_60147 [Vibrio crassostreae]